MVIRDFFVYLQRNDERMKPRKFLYIMLSSFSAKLSLWLGVFVTMLFMATFSLMFYYARQAVRDEALGKAEDVLDRFDVTLDNIFREKEVVAKQVHWTIEQCIDEPADVEKHVKHVLDHMPDVIGVAAAFEHHTYPGQSDDFMIYYHRKNGTIVKSSQFAGESYMQQPWYEETMRRETDYWSEPQDGYRTDNEPIISYAIPLKRHQKVIGVFAIDISLYWLTEMVNQQRPDSAILGSLVTRRGAFVVHPDTSLLKPRAMFKVIDMFPETEYSYVVYKMLGGETGHSQISFDGQRSFVAYKPFRDQGWEINIICPEDVFMAHYHHLISLMVVIVVIALLMIVAFCFFFIHKQLNPLRRLERLARRMKRGHYDISIPKSSRQDEVGSLTNSFSAMQRSIKKKMTEIDRRNLQLQEQNQALNDANVHIREADRVKSAFLRNMTDQMNEPVNEISKMVTHLAAHHQEMSHEQIAEMSNQMDLHSKTITNLLERVLDVSINKREEAS